MPRTTRPSPFISATNFGVSLASQRRYSCLSRQHCKHCLPSKRSLENSQSRLQDHSKREQRLEPGSYFVKHPCWSLGYKPRPSLLPRGTAQLIGLYNAADVVAVWYRDMKAPITITPRDRAGDAPTRQFIKGPRGKHERRAPPGLLVGDRLQEIEPNNIACLGAVGSHFTMPRYHAAGPNRPPAERCLGSFRSAIHRACNAAYALA